MRALVTGATGFIGTHLCKRLLADGHEVTALSHTEQDILGFVGNTKPDIVFHLATYFVYNHRPDDIESLVTGNILFPLKLIDAMARCGVKHLINTGSIWQTLGGIRNNPVCLQSATKDAVETLIRFYANSGNLGVITLHLTDTYGPNDKRRKLFTVLHEAADSGETLRMSEGQQQLSLVHIDDVIAAYIRAAEEIKDYRAAHSCYEVKAKPSEWKSLREIVELYSTISGKKINVEWGAKPYREREPMFVEGVYSNIDGWNPKITLEEGLATL